MRLPTLQRSGNELSSPDRQREVLSDPASIGGIESFDETLRRGGRFPLTRETLTTLQVNVGKVCNQTCSHCHVDAGPQRRESMSRETAEQVIAFLDRSSVDVLDITGGAPEMNPHFRMLVAEAAGRGLQVIDRCNLTILLAPGFTDLPPFLASHAVTVIASLPCYLEDNCDAQRGSGVFSKSIAAIRRLNELGYGMTPDGLQLNLVYNPVGTGLPPDQTQLELAYREQLLQRYDLRFNHLYTITNMPISRFLDDLRRRGELASYMEKLADSFNPATLSGLMCRSLISVDWQGFLYDCDFNQMLDLPIAGSRLHISQFEDSLEKSGGGLICTGNHCFGCTAGSGSSCSGSIRADG